MELDIYLQIAGNEGHNTDAWWKIRSILGQETQYSFDPDNFNNNQFKYLFDLATGNHNKKNKEGVAKWAKAELEKMFEKAGRKEDTLNAVVDGMVGGIGSTVRIGTRASSAIKAEARLIKAAQEMGENPRVQKEADDLIAKFLAGNTNPGLGNKNLFNNINYLRGDEGARVFFRMNNGSMQILAKANKHNEQTVINIIKKIYK
ncbi:hypothetical protein [Paenibacillus sp. KS-LC4]|uniref:hypothetical protein n=1 Tax=Paenibacillus sp. KS-LC4 TaxID=2979727 RepID=UPI0030D4B5C6